MNSYPTLSRINSPYDLRCLAEDELPIVAAELRAYLINTLAECGGHFASNLGSVELTVALHYIYDTPIDRLIWDVGHQSYPHKILTGRRDRLSTIRKLDGLAPFPKREESPYDSFGVGHSSTSISAGLGMSLAARAKGENWRRVVCVIGDGAMTAGMSYEALNHAGHVHADMLVVLNDNEMSISPNVGGLSNYLTNILSSHFYTSIREESKKVLKNVPPVLEFARKAEEHMKGMVTPGTLFEELGFNYFGPIDGHDLPLLVKTLRNLRALPGPQFLHVVTRKGKGYAPAEADPVAWHGVNRFDSLAGKLLGKSDGLLTYSQVFGQWICAAAAADKRVVGITPAMREGSGMVEFEQRFPERYHDVGICEQHAVTLAAGLACEGMRPIVAIYSTFLQRAYDQAIHDVALQNLPVVFALDRAGPVGADGATHHGAFDLTYLRCLPNMVVMTPSDEEECRRMLWTALQIDSPSAVRYPRGNGPGALLGDESTALPLGKGAWVKQGQEVALLVFGTLLAPALLAAEAHGASVVNMRFVKPLDEELILELAKTHRHLVTIEDNVVAGGAGSAVLECLARHEVTIPVTQLGLPDRFLEHGSREELLAQAGLDYHGIKVALARLSQRSVEAT